MSTNGRSTNGTGPLQDRTAIITGGSRGIGRETALRLTGKGANIVIADVNKEAGDCVVADIEAAGGSALFVETDVTDADATRALAAAAVDAYGGVDILVNNAGITSDATLKKMSEEAFDRVVDVNLKGVFNCTKAVLPHITESGAGRVLNAASVVGLYGNFGQTNYVATKSGVIGMTKTWARELGRHGVTVNAVAPGFIQTPMVDTVPQKVLDMLTNRTPLGRLGRAEDIANAYCFLASDEAAFITGTVLSVDGGLVLQEPGNGFNPARGRPLAATECRAIGVRPGEVARCFFTQINITGIHRTPDRLHVPRDKADTIVNRFGDAGNAEGRVTG